MSMRTINFTLNGQEVSTEIEPHRNLVELLQRFDAVRRARKLRAGPVRLLHCAGGRQSRIRLCLYFNALGGR